MDEFVFPEIKAHYAKVNGRDLIFNPSFASATYTSKAGFDLMQNCSGLTISEARDWLQGRYHGAPIGIVYNLMKMIQGGYFNERQLGSVECEDDLPPLTSFGIGTTHKCNMQCRYCFAAGMRGSGALEDISSDTAHAAVDFLFDVLKPTFVTVEFGITGEPQISWKTIESIISYAKKRSEESLVGMSFHMTTNGLEAHPDLLTYLRAYDDMNITLSWDGPPHIHNRQRLSFDGSDTHERVSGNFETFRITMKSRPSVVATVSALCPDIAGVFTHLFDAGVRDLIIKPFRGVDATMAVTDKSLPLFKAGYTELAELLLKPDHLQAERLFTILKIDDYLGRFILRLVQGSHETFRCMAARTHLEMDTNGDIYPCASLVGMKDFRIGDIYAGLDERSVKSFRERTFLGNQQQCNDCWAKFYCGGPCAYVSTISAGTPGIPYQPDCELTKHLIELAGYIVTRLNIERPGLLSHVRALRNIVPMGRRPEAACYKAPPGGLRTSPIEEWRVTDPIVLAGKENLGGSTQRPTSSELTAKIHLRWDNEFLYLMAEVADPTFLPPVSAESEWWLRDSIQFAIDPQKDGGEGTYPWKLPLGDYEFGVAYAAGSTYFYDCQLDPLQPRNDGIAFVTRQDNLTTYRVALPWKQLAGFDPSVGAECRFSIVVNDCDHGVRRWLQWTNGLATKKAPARFGLLRLVD